jgi:Spy/CpxP family protein refolding chaperone
VRRALLRGLLVLSLAVNAAVAFHAVRRARGMGEGGMPAEPLLFKRLSLDAAQRSAILAKRESLMARRAATSARLGELRVELATALSAGEAGRPRIDAVLAEMERAQREYQRSVVEHLLGVRELLTPAQRPVFETLLGDRLHAGWMMQPDGVVPGDRGGGGK